MPIELRLELRAGLRVAPQSHVRTCVRTCASRMRTCVRLCAGRILRPPPPSLPFGSPFSRMKDYLDRNETCVPCRINLSPRDGILFLS